MAAIQWEMDDLDASIVHELSEVEQQEQVREIYQLAFVLTGDFRRVEDEIRQMDKHLRVEIIEGGQTRREVLISVMEREAFAGTIVAASLAYVLTPDGGNRPVYCTVFLDEAFSNTAEMVSLRVLRVFREMQIRINLVTPCKNLNLARETAKSVLIAERDTNNHDTPMSQQFTISCKLPVMGKTAWNRNGWRRTGLLLFFRCRATDEYR